MDGKYGNLAHSLVRTTDTHCLHMLGNLEEKNRQVFPSLRKPRANLQVVTVADAKRLVIRVVH